MTDQACPKCSVEYQGVKRPPYICPECEGFVPEVRL